MSTTLEIGRWPAAIRRAFSQYGDGPTLTFSKIRAVKRGQRSVSIVTSMPASAPSLPGSCAHGAGPSAAPVAAWTSRATP